MQNVDKIGMGIIKNLLPLKSIVSLHEVNLTSMHFKFVGYSHLSLKKQLSKVENRDCLIVNQLSHVRIHVERVICYWCNQTEIQ